MAKTGPRPYSLETVQVCENALEVSPMLLNLGDWFELQIVVDGRPSGGVVVTARVAGVSEVRNRGALDMRRNLCGIAFLFVVLLCGVIAVSILIGFVLYREQGARGPSNPSGLCASGCRLCISCSSCA